MKNFKIVIVKNVKAETEQAAIDSIKDVLDFDYIITKEGEEDVKDI